MELNGSIGASLKILIWTLWTHSSLWISVDLFGTNQLEQFFNKLTVYIKRVFGTTYLDIQPTYCTEFGIYIILWTVLWIYLEQSIGFLWIYFEQSIGFLWNNQLDFCGFIWNNQLDFC